MIWESVKVFTDVRKNQRVCADDWYDKLNRSTTVILLLIAAALIYSNKFFSTQISCIDEPSRIDPIGLDYVNALCLAKDTYNVVDFDGGNENKNTDQYRSYYPWLFFIVCSFAILFYLPYVIWKSFIRNNYYHHLPIDVSGIANLLNKSEVLKKDDFEKNIKISSEYLDKCLSVNNFTDGIPDNESQKTISYFANKQPKNYCDRRNKKTKLLYLPLVYKYLFVKLCYLAISIGVFFLAAQFLQLKEADSFYKFGVDAISQWIDQKEHDPKGYLKSKYFPRVILCGEYLSLNILFNEDKKKLPRFCIVI